MAAPPSSQRSEDGLLIWINPGAEALHGFRRPPARAPGPPRTGGGGGSAGDFGSGPGLGKSRLCREAYSLRVPDTIIASASLLWRGSSAGARGSTAGAGSLGKIPSGRRCAACNACCPVRFGRRPAFCPLRRRRRRRRHTVVVVEQQPMGGAFHVLELIVAHRPPECGTDRYREHHRKRDQQVQDVHAPDDACFPVARGPSGRRGGPDAPAPTGQDGPRRNRKPRRLMPRRLIVGAPAGD